jgi:pectin methylesterase-like acyl-CoA thioesterase
MYGTAADKVIKEQVKVPGQQKSDTFFTQMLVQNIFCFKK